MAPRLTHAFPGDEAALWRAVRAALPLVTTQATFWERARRVEWSSGATPFSWEQIFESWVEAGPNGGAVLALSSKSSVRPSFGDRGRRAATFRALVGGVSEALSRQAACDAPPGDGRPSDALPCDARPSDARDALPTEDRVRYWNGDAWVAEPRPPPPPGPP